MDNVRFTWRTVRLKNADGTLNRVTCAVRAESDGHIEETTFAYWLPQSEALRRAETAYKADRLRESAGRPQSDCDAEQEAAAMRFATSESAGDGPIYDE